MVKCISLIFLLILSFNSFAFVNSDRPSKVFEQFKFKDRKKVLATANVETVQDYLKANIQKYSEPKADGAEVFVYYDLLLLVYEMRLERKQSTSEIERMIIDYQKRVSSYEVPVKIENIRKKLNAVTDYLSDKGNFNFAEFYLTAYFNGPVAQKNLIVKMLYSDAILQLGFQSGDRVWIEKKIKEFMQLEIVKGAVKARLIRRALDIFWILGFESEYRHWYKELEAIKKESDPDVLKYYKAMDSFFANDHVTCLSLLVDSEIEKIKDKKASARALNSYLIKMRCNLELNRIADAYKFLQKAFPITLENKRLNKYLTEHAIMTYNIAAKQLQLVNSYCKKNRFTDSLGEFIKTKEAAICRLVSKGNFVEFQKSTMELTEKIKTTETSLNFQIVKLSDEKIAKDKDKLINSAKSVYSSKDVLVKALTQF